MNFAGVQNAQVVQEGSTVAVSYNPQDTTYEAQIVNEWGAIFGVLLKSYPNAQAYQIIQQFNGQKVAELTVNATDLKAYSNGAISINELRVRMGFKGGS